MNGGVLVAHASLDVPNRPLMKLILRQMVLLEREQDQRLGAFRQGLTLGFDAESQEH